MRLLRLSLTVALLWSPASAVSAAARTAGSPLRGATPTVVPVLTGLDGPSAFTFGPGRTIWFAERGTGRIRIYDRDTRVFRTFTDVDGVDGTGERGALGLALHPDYPQRPFVYLYVTRTDGGTLVNELLRFRAEGGRAVARSVLFRWSVTGASNHNGGRILFGPDGNLWVVTGENADPANSQRLANLRGKILRIRPDGSIPDDNPFSTRVYAFGIRNSFGMAFDPQTGMLWETENGPSCNDEINRIRRGGNFAWGPTQSCGSLTAPRDTNRDGPTPRLLPATYFRQTIAITGAAFCDGCGLAGLQGDLLFGDVGTPHLWHANLTADRRSIESRSMVIDLPIGVHSMEAAPSGAIFFSNEDGIYRLAG
jgi:glucose/arabinose dehydrogenase